MDKGNSGTTDRKFPIPIDVIIQAYFHQQEEEGHEGKVPTLQSHILWHETVRFLHSGRVSVDLEVSCPGSQDTCYHRDSASL